MKYQLGSSDREQERLERQAQLYNDAQYIQFEKAINICEFGCGSGANLWIAKKLGNGKYIGLDAQEKQIEKAKNKAQEMQLKNVEFYVADAMQVPVSDNWSDLSFCRLVLIHNPEPLKLLKEMRRVAKATGKILAIEPNTLSFIAYNKPFLNKCFHARVKYMYQAGKGTLDICPQLYHLFKQAGLSEISIKQHDIYCDSREPEQLKLFYENWMNMLDVMKDTLISKGIISHEDYNTAKKEATEINDGDSIYQSLWIAEGMKS